MPDEHVVSDAERAFCARSVFPGVAGCCDSPCIVNNIRHQKKNCLEHATLSTCMGSGLDTSFCDMPAAFVNSNTAVLNTSKESDCLSAVCCLVIVSRSPISTHRACMSETP